MGDNLSLLEKFEALLRQGIFPLKCSLRAKVITKYHQYLYACFKKKIQCT